MAKDHLIHAEASRLAAMGYALVPCPTAMRNVHGLAVGGSDPRTLSPIRPGCKPGSGTRTAIWASTC